MSIADNLAYLMQQQGISETELARALDTSVMTIRRLLSGETEDPRIFTVKAIADYFQTSVDFLLCNLQQQPISRLQCQRPECIPLLEWDCFTHVDTLQALDLSAWTAWYPVVSLEHSAYGAETFALRSRPSMQPRFSLGTILVINQAERPADGDLILVKIRSSQQLSLRQLRIDPPRWQLQPIVAGSDVLFFAEDQHSILGVVLLTVSSRHVIESNTTYLLK